MASLKHFLHLRVAYVQRPSPPDNESYVDPRSLNTNQSKRYKGSEDEQRVEDVWLEGEESQTHVGEDEVLCQEVQELKQLVGGETNNYCRQTAGWLEEKSSENVL